MNMQQMMQQMQTMQKKMQELQKVMAEKEITGTSGGELVTITITGKGDIKKISIDKSLINVDEKEILEDLIVAAFNNARQNVDQYTNEEMSKLGIPPNILKHLNNG